MNIILLVTPQELLYLITGDEQQLTQTIDGRRKVCTRSLTLNCLNLLGGSLGSVRFLNQRYSDLTFWYLKKWILYPKRKWREEEQ